MTTEYPKINGVFKRHLEGPDKGRFITGDWSVPEFELLQDVPWNWSEKIDGTNIRLVYDPMGGPHLSGLAYTPTVTIQGRTDRAQLHKDLVAAIEAMIDRDLWVKTFKDKLVIVYGEGYGAGIQGVGGLYRPDKSFIGFDVRVWNTWLTPEGSDDVMQELGLPTVTRFDSLSLRSALSAFRYKMSRAEFPTNTHPDAFEGVVGRPVGGLLDRFGHRIQTKLKVVDFRE